MGRDKALIELDGQPLATRLRATLLTAGVDPVVLVGGQPSWAEALGMTVVPDMWPGLGPLAGVASALAWSPAPTTVVVACDQPDLSPRLIRRLVEALGTHPESSVAMVADDGRLQPFPTVWDSSVGSNLEARIAQGERRISDVLEDLTRVEVRWDLDEIIDLDDPQDISARSERHRRGGPRTGPVEPRLPRMSGHSPPPGGTVEIPEIDIAEAVRRQVGARAVIDVREPDEYVEGHVPGAVLIPLGEVPDRLGEVPSDGEVLVICKAGGRSRKAAEVMRASGIDAVNIGGGTMAWIEAGHPVVTGDQPGSST